MLSLVCSGLALTVGVKAPINLRAQPASMMAYGHSAMGLTFDGKLPESCSMAGAIPIIIGASGTEATAGNQLVLDPVREGTTSDFVYGRAEPLSKVLSCSFATGPNKVVPMTAPPMDFN